jgi:hypothetical protein
MEIPADYVPFGEEWKKEVRKLKKDLIIDIFSEKLANQAKNEICLVCDKALIEKIKLKINEDCSNSFEFVSETEYSITLRANTLANIFFLGYFLRLKHQLSKFITNKNRIITQ